MPPALLKTTDFTLVSRFSVVDNRKRLTLGSIGIPADAYNVYRNEAGQIVLDPVKDVPLSEAWLWQSPTASAAVKRGIEQAEQGEIHDLGDFSKFAKG